MVATVLPPTALTLSDDCTGHLESGPWIGPLVALGARLSRVSQKLSGRQLVVVISVPLRDFAAALVGCGWTLARPVSKLEQPLALARKLEERTPVRVVTENHVLTDYFFRLDDSTSVPRLHLLQSHWQVDKIRAMAVLPFLDESMREPRPSPGSIWAMAGRGENWDHRLASPAADLAIIGTLKWLHDDLEAYLGRPGIATQVPDKIASLLLPQGKHAATWSTRLYASAGLADELPLPDDTSAVILDGSGAIKYAEVIEAPVIVAILDRSVSDESPAELLLQMRNSGGAPLSVQDDLGWQAPFGVEALAFTVPL